LDKDSEPQHCPMARMNEKQLKEAGFVTRPTQLGFFLIPEDMRIKMELPERPTEIPNICVITDHDFETHGMPEPKDALFRYPALDYYLAYWKYLECICKGNGQNAEWYPFSPDSKHFRKPRACKYKECKHYDGKKMCKEVGDLYFRVPGTPGYPGFWKFSTRSAKSIRYMIQELTQIWDDCGKMVSRIPLKLTCEPETGKVTLEGGAKIKTDVFRVHIRTDFTWEEVERHKKKIKGILFSGEEQRQLAAATPEVAPIPSPPVEQAATDDPENWNDNDVIDVEGKPVAAKPEKEKKEPVKKKEPKKEKAKEPVKEERPAESPEDAMLNEALAQEEKVIEIFRACNTMAELKKAFGEHKGDFRKYKEIGFKPKKLKKVMDGKKAILASKAEKAGEPSSGDENAAKQDEKSVKPPAETKKQTKKKASGATKESLLADLKSRTEGDEPEFDIDVAIELTNDKRKADGKKEADSLDDFTVVEIKEVLNALNQAG